MTCQGCNTPPSITKDQLLNIINGLIDDGTLSGGLSNCNGDKVTKGEQVVLCHALADAVRDLLNNGEIDIVSDIYFEDGKLKMEDSTGKVTTIEVPYIYDFKFDPAKNELKWSVGGLEKTQKLPYVKGTTSGDNVVLTLPDGSTVKLPKDGLLSTDSFDHTITMGANVPKKLGVKIAPGGGLTVGESGLAIDSSFQGKHVQLVDASGKQILGSVVVKE